MADYKTYKIKYMIKKGRMVFLDKFTGSDLPMALKLFYHLHSGIGRIRILDIQEVPNA